MDVLTLIILAGMFSPGLIRGAFWHDSPSTEGFVWMLATIGFVVAVGWISLVIFGNWIANLSVILSIIATNIYAFKGSTFLSSRKVDYIDGDTI